jgi:hypothetical protein
MAPRPFIPAVLLAGLAAMNVSCNRTAGVAIEDVRPSRVAGTNAISVDVEVAGYEQSGGSVGAYCVSVHFCPEGFIADLTDPQPGYFAELDRVETCVSPSEVLKDGDRRTFRFVSHRTDIPANLNLRAQSRIGHEYDYMDVPTP